MLSGWLQASDLPLRTPANSLSALAHSLRAAANFPRSPMNSAESEPFQQIIPCATQSLTQFGQHWNGRRFGTALDLLEKTPAQVGLLRQRLLRQGTGRAQTVHIFAKDLAGGWSHQPSLARTLPL